MKEVWIIARRELQSFFDSLMAYIMIIAFLGFTGFFTWMFSTNVFVSGQASLQVFFGWAYWTLFIFIPALTMRQIAEELKTGTIELLLTKPVSDWQVVFGKFLATLLLVIVSLVLTLPYYFTVANLGPIDKGAVWSGYLGLILMSASYISIGIFTSSVTSNQIVAFLLALLIALFFHLIFGLIAATSTGTLGQVLDFLNMQSHFESISRGVIDTKDIIYFLSITFLSLTGSEVMLAKRHIN